MDKQHTKNVVEAALMCAGAPLEVNEILRLFDEADRPTRKQLDEAIEELTEDYENRAMELQKVASGYRIQVRSQFADMLGRLDGKRAPKYSRALLETLALVAYRQPVTRGEIESVRGVSVSSNIVRTLLERGWVRIVGHRDVPGRPAMLGTTKAFLDYFGLTSLDELPALSELKDFDSINVELEFGAPPAELEAPDATAPEGSDGEASNEDAAAADADATERDGEPSSDDPAELAAADGDNDNGEDEFNADTEDDTTDPAVLTQHEHDEAMDSIMGTDNGAQDQLSASNESQLEQDVDDAELVESSTGAGSKTTGS